MSGAERINSIAIVRADRLGDMTLTLPLFGALRRALPSARLSLIALSYVEPLLYRCPVVDDVLYADRLSGGISEALASIQPDAVFFPRPRFSEALAAFSRRIPIRVGSLYRWYSPLFTDKIPEHRSDGRRHEAEYNTRMAEIMLERRFPGQFQKELFSADIVRPHVMPEAADSIRRILEASGINYKRKFIVIHPGSGGSARDWPVENFARAASIFANDKKISVVVTGIEAESRLCQHIADYSQAAVNLCGKLNLAEMIALLDLSSVMIANSTGVLHIAAALGVRVIGLYPNSPNIGAKRWGPKSSDSIVLTPSDGDRMELIEVEQVATSAMKLMIG